jgi:hypothetical protein
VFCSEKETITHLFFFYFTVAKCVWRMISESMNVVIGDDYLSMAAKWLQNDKYYVVNVASDAVLRGLWLTRNDFVFKKQEWLDVKGGVEEDSATDAGMGANNQGIESGGADPRAIEDRKRLKFTRK